MRGVRISVPINAKNPHSAFAKAGSLSLAVFLKRPQADSQIGAPVTVVKQQGSVNILFSGDGNHCPVKNAGIISNILPGF